MTMIKKGKGKLGINRISKDGNIITFPLWIASNGKESIKRTTRKDLQTVLKTVKDWEYYAIYKAYANLNLDLMTVSVIKEIGE